MARTGVRYRERKASERSSDPRAADAMDPHVQVKIDPSTNAKFYFNTRTKKSGWHLHEVSDTHAAREHVVAKVARERPAKVAAAHVSGASALHPDVQIKVDPNTNARFYYNKKTKKSGWH